MKKPLLFILFTAGLALSVMAQQPAGAATFTKDQLSADLSFLIKTIENVHPHPYHAISKERMGRLRDSVQGLFKDGMTARDAWPGLARIVAALDEGHSNFNHPASFVENMRSGGEKLFPILVNEYDGEALYTRYNLSGDSSLATGDRILSVNGRPVKELVDYFTSFYGGLPVWRQLQVMNDFAGNLAFHGILPPYRVVYRKGDTQKEMVVDGLLFPEIIARVGEIRKKMPATGSSSPYTFSRLENNTGYLNFRSMRDLDRFSVFLDSVFTEIKNNPVSGLIIDLRQNGGGNSALGEKLLSYITDKPYLMAAGTLWKVSEEYKAFIREQEKTNSVYASAGFQHYLKFENGKLIGSDKLKPRKPAGNPLRYTGKTCFLIGPRTFSSANMLANAIKDFQLATLIGEPTGEPANDYGEMYWNKLPNTGFSFSTCSKQFVRANGDKDDPNPILPDITVKQDRASGKDDVLEYAKKWMLGGN